MTQHPSLKSGAKGAKFRSVLKRYEKIAELAEKDKWTEEKDSIYHLPKVKRIKFKAKKVKAEAEAAVGAEGAVAAAGAPAKGPAGAPAKGSAGAPAKGPAGTPAKGPAGAPAKAPAAGAPAKPAQKAK